MILNCHASCACREGVAPKVNSHTSDTKRFANATLTWQLNSTVSLLAGYRHLYVDYETGSGQDFYAYKVHHTGPGIGIDLRF